MGHESATMRHRPGTEPRRRSIVRVALLSVCAVVATACGSSDTSGSSDSTPVPVGAQESAVMSADWGFQMLNPDGTALATRLADDGTQVNGYVVGQSNRLQATVPAEVLASATDVVLEERTPNGVWNDTGITLALFDASGTAMQLPVNASGTAKATFPGGGAFVGPHEFRLRAQTRFAQVVVAYSNVVQATGFLTEGTVVATSSDWGFEVQRMDGTPLGTLPAADGTEYNAYVINKTYTLRATVPAELVASGAMIDLQERMPNGVWRGTGDVLSVDATTGTATGTFVAGPYYFDQHEFRLRANATVYNKMQPVAYSYGVLATGLLKHTITLVNNTTNDLKIFIPVTYDSAAEDWSEAEVSLGQGERKTLLYVNPEAGSAIHLKVTRQDCFMGCSVYLTDWEWAPDGMQSCSRSRLNIASGGDYTITLSDDIDGQSAGFKVGTFEGPLEGPGTATTSCTFITKTHTGTWIKSHPWKAVGIGVGILAIIVATVIVAVVMAPVIAGALGLAGATTGAATETGVSAAAALTTGGATEAASSAIMVVEGSGAAANGAFIVGPSAATTEEAAIRAFQLAMGF